MRLTSCWRLNHDVSVSAIADPIRKIEALLAKHAAERAQ